MSNSPSTETNTSVTNAGDNNVAVATVRNGEDYGSAVGGSLTTTTYDTDDDDDGDYEEDTTESSEDYDTDSSDSEDDETADELDVMHAPEGGTHPNVTAADNTEEIDKGTPTPDELDLI
ncbi:hypothetical protein BD410DRAFT_903305 [Rickenella mellea]|uniref:Uncharacterized protein n=1 Tax=Rickenella mellea TaxID=50990 RepID=A0A4Y7PGD6_9AGAM|nr:hypothetical protein BD410DRAFT_903305 [Rickenella mellea]